MLRITEQGLQAIAILVAILWGCIFLEKSIVTRARNETYRALEQMRVLQMKKPFVPAAAPVPAFRPGPPRPIAG